MSNTPFLWRMIQKENFTSLEKLCTYLQLDAAKKKMLLNMPSFPLNVPKRLAAKIAKNCLTDPLLRQFVPLQEELKVDPQFIQDPVGDTLACVEPKLLKKYAGRALFLTTGACAMHCRYCFRRHFSYSSFQSGFSKEIQLIKKDSSIQEVILSGGDPLSLSNTILKELLTHLAAIPHVKRIRFHSRFAIGIPERIDHEFLQILETTPVQFWFVVHVNHHKELDSDIFSALKNIQKLGIPVLNQSVLLKGVNDTLEALQTLCETLINNGISPYYLHQLDRVEGATHFEVEQELGLQLVQALQEKLSGYGVPKYVQEIPKKPSKTSITRTSNGVVA